MRSGLRRLTERLEIGARLFHSSPMKGGLALDRPQPVLMVADPGDELILLHPRLDHLGRIHEERTPAGRKSVQL